MGIASSVFVKRAGLVAALLCFPAALSLPRVTMAATQAPASPPAAGTAASTEASHTAPTVSVPAASGAATTTAAAPTAPAKSAASAPAALTLPQQIAALPKLDNAGIDVSARSKEILDHLNDVLRFYRGAAAQIQKIGEPSDVLYSEQLRQQSTQIAQLAFQAAGNEAALLAKLSGGAVAPSPNSGSDNAPAGDEPPAPTQAQRIAAFRATTQARLADLTAQDAALDKQIQTAKAKELPALRQKDEQIEGQLELQKAMLEALGKVASMAQAQTSTGLAGDIQRLLRAAPELSSAAANKPLAPPPIESLAAERDSGVSTQAVNLFQLLAARTSIDDMTREVDALTKQASSMREPVVNLLKSTIAQGDAAMQAAPDATASDAQTLAATRKRYDTLATTFRVLSTAVIPLSQEMVMLEQTRSNLQSWRAAVNAEYSTVLRSLLLRVLTIALALLALFIASYVWKRLTVKYISDLRRRRQIMLIRRAVLGFLGGLIVIFGFVTQFSSLATFAGFITAGIAVGLQTILLSVAAYFFIIGRYGVRVGDRISVAGVTGDVVEVGLVRFYMMELTGTGTELHPTGRVAVFANSILFQSGTPLYKQMPGTEYAWHELTVRLKPDTDYRPATEAVLHAVQTTYDSYRALIEKQHHTVETWMDTALEAPHIEPRLQLAENGLQYAVLFPVEIKDAATTDEKIVHLLLDAMASNAAIKDAIAAPPTVKAVIKG
ncbi:mechanosensitive ion channel family protein [Terriglobus roseus]|nr:mechanosensitive ion channel family protein [Terriglobus roseus]